MKKPIAQRLGDFLAGKGFYIVLFLCLAAIGISGYYLYASTDLTGTPVAATARVTVTPTPSQSSAPGLTWTAPESTIPTTSPTPAATLSPSPSVSAAPSPSPSQQASAPAAFVWPVQGEVIAAFSSQTLTYDQTMGDWRTHGGMDIAAPLGQQVMAVSAGTVIDVFDDDLLGTTVILDHGDGLTSTYSNLAAVPTVEVGDTVRTGDVIGAVGDTAIAESTQSAHLHLEMAENGSPVNPSDYLPG